MATGRPEGGGKGQASSLKSGSFQGLTAAKANSQGLLQRMANEAVRGNNERQLASVHSELAVRRGLVEHAQRGQDEFRSAKIANAMANNEHARKSVKKGEAAVAPDLESTPDMFHTQEEAQRDQASLGWDIYNLNFRPRPFVQGGANAGSTQPIARQGPPQEPQGPGDTGGQPLRTPEEVQRTKQEALDLWTGPRPMGTPGDVNPNSKRERVGNPSQFSGTPGPESRGHDTTVTGEIVGEGRPFRSSPKPTEEPVTGELVPTPLGSRAAPRALSTGGAHPHISDLKGAKQTRSGQWSVPREHLEPFGGVAGYKHPNWKYLGGNRTHARFGSINDQSTSESESTNSMI